MTVPRSDIERFELLRPGAPDSWTDALDRLRKLTEDRNVARATADKLHAQAQSADPKDKARLTAELGQASNVVIELDFQIEQVTDALTRTGAASAGPWLASQLGQVDATLDKIAALLDGELVTLLDALAWQIGAAQWAAERALEGSGVAVPRPAYDATADLLAAAQAWRMNVEDRGAVAKMRAILDAARASA